MAIHYHSSLDANLVVAFGARGRGKKNVHELFTRNENEKDGRIRAERERKKNRTANCSLLALLRVGRASLDNISRDRCHILSLAEIRGFVAKRKEESRLISHFHYGKHY